jgi:hypothetical protein
MSLGLNVKVIYSLRARILISRRILHDTMYPSVSLESAHMSSSEGSHILYGSLHTERPLNWIHPWIQLI